MRLRLFFDFETVEENNAAIHSTFGTAKVRRHTNTNVMMQYVPGYQTGFGSSNNKESKGSDGEEEEDEENNDDNTDASDSSFTTPYDFLMPFDHFCESMSHIHIGFIAPLDPSSWTIRSVTGKWAARVGGCATPVDLEKWSRNPRYKLDVPEPNVTVEELERRKRSQVNKKTNVTNVIVSLRQSVRLSSPNASPLDTTLGLRFVPCGKSIGKYSSQGHANGSTVVDIFITPPSFKLDSLSQSRSLLSKTPKQVFF